MPYAVRKAELEVDGAAVNQTIKGEEPDKKAFKVFLSEVRVGEILVTLTHALNTKVDEYTKMDFTQNMRQATITIKGYATGDDPRDQAWGPSPVK